VATQAAAFVTDSEPPLLDVRAEADFLRAHRSGAVNIPLEDLGERAHELPPRAVAMRVYDSDARRARRAADLLRARGRGVEVVVSGADWLASGPTESGRSTRRLWRPHGLLVEALDLFEREATRASPRRAVDVACGSGRDAVYLAEHGWSVDAWDLLPDALLKARALAATCGVAISRREIDVERLDEWPTGAFDLVCCFKFLHRPIVPRIAGMVRPGGLLVYETFVDPQIEQFGKPATEQHVLRRGELADWFRDWKVLLSREGLQEERCFLSSLVAQRPDR
jgi:tellurite methyltransferase